MCKLLSKKMVCERTSASLPTVNRWLKSGRMAFTRVGGRILVPESEIERLAGLARPFGADAPVVAESAEVQ